MKLRCIAWCAIIALLAIAAVPLTTGDVVPEADGHNDETQILQPVSEPPIKLVHVLNPGEREYLSPNLIGVQNIAMTYLPLTMNFINVIDAYREIVDGVRYEILLNAVDTKANDTDIICRMVILEKPWLRTEWGDKVRELRHSNCTSEEENFTDPMAKNRALNDKYERNALFNGGTRNELNSDEMDKLAAQIMPNIDGPKKYTSTTKKTTTSTTAATTTTTTENIERAVNAVTPAPNTDDDDADDDDDDTEVNTEFKELSDDEKKWIDDILSVGALNFEKSVHTDNKNDDDESTEITDRTEKPENLLQQQATLTQDQQRSELEMEQFEPIHVRSKRSYDRFVGGHSRLDTDEAQQILKNSLSKLAAGEGPNYTTGKIFSATKQVVSGTMTIIDAELFEDENDKMRCTISIWSQIWLPNGDEVTVKCPGKKTLKKRLTRSVSEYAEKKTHKKHAHHGYEKTEHLFNKFQVKYNKRYHSSMEHQMRLRIFKQNIKTIEELNRNEMGSAKYGITEFADMTSSEYKQRTGLWQRSEDKPSNHPMADIPDIELPKEFDWREKGAISEVKNQGSCGSCWAFSVTGNIEGLHAVQTGRLEEYSEQELLDCDTIDSACNGGLPDNAYEAIQKIGGLELESEYPYEGRKNQCNFNKTMSHVQVKGAVDLPKNETAMAQWLIANGPISIGINANAMQFYRGGVSHPWRPLCSHSNLDHGVLIVGFGVSDYPMFKKTLPYWIVKNSWGKKWGEQGYYRVYRGDNTCGISEMATSAVLG